VSVVRSVIDISYNNVLKHEYDISSFWVVEGTVRSWCPGMTGL